MINAQEWLQYKNNEFEDSFASLCSDDKNTLSLKRLIITKELAKKITPDIYYMGLYAAAKHQAAGIFDTLLNTMIKNNIEENHTAIIVISDVLMKKQNLDLMRSLNEKTDFIDHLLNAQTDSLLEPNDLIGKFMPTFDMSKIDAEMKTYKDENKYSIRPHIFENACLNEAPQIVELFLNNNQRIDPLALAQGFWLSCINEDMTLATVMLANNNAREIIKNNEEIQSRFLNSDAKNQSPFLMQVNHILEAFESKENLQKEIHCVSPDAHRVTSKI